MSMGQVIAGTTEHTVPYGLAAIYKQAMHPIEMARRADMRIQIRAGLAEMRAGFMQTLHEMVIDGEITTAREWDKLSCQIKAMPIVREQKRDFGVYMGNAYPNGRLVPLRKEQPRESG